MEDDIREVIDDASTILKYVEDKWQKYGQRFLDLCIKHNINGIR